MHMASRVQKKAMGLQEIGTLQPVKSKVPPKTVGVWGGMNVLWVTTVHEIGRVPATF